MSNFNCESGFLSSGSTKLPYTKTSMKNREGMLHCITNEPQLPLRKKEIEIENLGFSRFIVYPMLETLALFLRMGKIDNSIMLNNWGISTNLYPKNPNLDEFGQIIDSVLKNNKKDAIIFRSINSTTCSIWRSISSIMASTGFFQETSYYFPTPNFRSTREPIEGKLIETLNCKKNMGYIGKWLMS